MSSHPLRYGLISIHQFDIQKELLNKDLFLWTLQTNIIQANGYSAETHVIRTDDGYLLQVHRILPLSKGNARKKYPVILKHGNFQSSADWVLNVPSNHSLGNVYIAFMFITKSKVTLTSEHWNLIVCIGFLLADAGYDTWLVNQRGNTYSNSHETFPLSSQRFWNFRLGVSDSPYRLFHVLIFGFDVLVSTKLDSMMFQQKSTMSERSLAKKRSTTLASQWERQHTTSL